LGRRLTHPTLTAGVAALDDRQVLVVGGTPALSFVEVYSVPLPDEEGMGSERMPVDNFRKLSYVMEGRMGCQAAPMMLPRRGGSFPFCNARCVVLVGGECLHERGADGQRVEQFCSVLVYDIDSGAWRDNLALPSMAAPRTAVALCVGIGTPPGS